MAVTALVGVSASGMKRETRAERAGHGGSGRRSNSSSESHKNSDNDEEVVRHGKGHGDRFNRPVIPSPSISSSSSD